MEIGPQFITARREAPGDLGGKPNIWRSPENYTVAVTCCAVASTNCSVALSRFYKNRYSNVETANKIVSVDFN